MPVQPFEIEPQVCAVRRTLVHQREKDACLEPAAKPRGNSGHFNGITERLLAIVEFFVASTKLRDLRLLADQFGRSSHFTSMLQQPAKPGQCCNITRINLQQSFQFPALDADLTALEGKPGVCPVGLGPG